MATKARVLLVGNSHYKRNMEAVDGNANTIRPFNRT